MRARGLRGVASAVLALVSLNLGPVSLDVGAQAPSPPQPIVFLDVVVLDDAGRPVTTLMPGDLRVVIDDEPRAVVELRYVFGGTGAGAAARAGVGHADTKVAADPSRLILVAVDENSFASGAEQAVTSAVRAVGDVFAPADRVALVTLPQPRAVTAESDRQRFRDDLGRVRGRAAATDVAAATGDQRGAGSDRPLPGPERTETAEEPGRRLEVPAEPQPRSPDAGQAGRAQQADAPVSRASIDVLAELLQGWRDVQGPKTVIYVWGGTWGPDPADPTRPYQPRRDLDRVVSAAAVSRTVIHAVMVRRSVRARADADLERLARDTGGVVAITDPTGTWPGRLAEVMAGRYLVGIEERKTDRDRALRSLSVSATKTGLTVLAARRWAARDDPAPSPVEAAPAAAATREAAPSASGLARGPVRDAELATVMARASEFLEAYLRDFSSVVAEEEYLQSVTHHRASGDFSRKSVRLRSDLLLLRTKSALDWTPFRDVFEVDGRPVRDREDRLRRLFLEHPDTALQEGARLTQESSRYNVGPEGRTLNTPTLGLFFLLPRHQSHIRYERIGEDTLEGVRVWRIGFEEVQGPTVISDARTGLDLPSKGELWIEPATGRVVKTLVRCEAAGFRDELIVIYRRSDTLGMWAPAEMKERYNSGKVFVTGEAKYSQFRRFQVSTDEQVGVPKS